MVPVQIKRRIPFKAVLNQVRCPPQGASGEKDCMGVEAPRGCKQLQVYLFNLGGFQTVDTMPTSVLPVLAAQLKVTFPRASKVSIMVGKLEAWLNNA